MTEPGSYDMSRMACALCTLAPRGVAWCARCEALVKTEEYSGLIPLEFIPRAAHRRYCFGCNPRPTQPLAVADLSWCERCIARAASRRPIPPDREEHPPDAAVPHIVNHSTRAHYFF